MPSPESYVRTLGWAVHTLMQDAMCAYMYVYIAILSVSSLRSVVMCACYLAMCLYIKCLIKINGIIHTLAVEVTLTAGQQLQWYACL